jgi:hypothetical protein
MVTLAGGIPVFINANIETDFKVPSKLKQQLHHAVVYLFSHRHATQAAVFITKPNSKV